MCANFHMTHPHPPASPGRRDLLTHALCLLLVTVVTGLLLDRAEVERVVYPATPNLSGDAELDALLWAIQCRDVPAVQRLLRRGRADLNASDKAGARPLHYALCARGATAEVLVDLLIDAGADVRVWDRDGGGGGTPLLVHAASLGRPELVARLLGAGANPGTASRVGWTGLHYAALCDDAQTVAVLLAAGADPHAEDDEGNTPFDVATAHGSRATAALLRAPSQRRAANGG